MANVFIPRSNDARYIEDDSEFYVVKQIKGPNLVKNGGFELGVDFWTFYHPTASSVGATLTTGLYGGFAAKLYPGNTVYQMLDTPNNSGYLTGEQYYLHADIKLAQGSTGSVTVYQGNSFGTPVSSKVYPLTTDWTKVLFQYTPTALPHYIWFAPTSLSAELVIDNVCMTREPLDIHIPMPQALGMKCFDLTGQKAPFISAAGVMAKLIPLSDYGFVMSAVVGLGYENPQHNTIKLPSGQEKLLSTQPAAKEFSITGTISDASSLNVDRKKAALIQQLASSPDMPVILAHKRRGCRIDQGELGFIQCLYTGGLGIQRTSNHIQDISLDFTQLDPVVYYGPKSLYVDTINSLRQPLDTRASTAAPYNPYFFRYKGQPYRSPRDTGITNLAGGVRGAIEDANGDLWIWGGAAEDMIIGGGGSVTATSIFVVRLRKYAGGPFTAFNITTTALGASIRGALPLKNGDILFYGKFTSPSIGIARWDSRTDTLVAVPGLTTSSSDPGVSKLSMVGTRIHFTLDNNLSINGVSSGTDAVSRVSTYFTDDQFVTFTPASQFTAGNTVVMETDDDGNVYILVKDTSGADDDVDIYSQKVYPWGVSYTELMFKMDEDSAHVFESYVVPARIIRRAHGFAIGYDYAAVGSATYIPSLLDYRSAMSRTVQVVPDGSFEAITAYSDDNGTISTFDVFENSALPGATSNYAFLDRFYTGAVSYTAKKKLDVPHSRWVYRTPNWEMGYEAWVNPYRVVPSHTLVTNPSAVRTNPVIRFMGGGYRTFIGKVFNETNGSSVTLSGQLRGGEELYFDPLNPVLPSEITMIDNSGPDGVFALEPGENSIIVQVNTLWAPISASVSGSNIVRHLLLKSFVSTQYTGKVRMTHNGTTFSFGAASVPGAISGVSVTSEGLAASSFLTSGNYVRLVPMTQFGGSGTTGITVLYPGTYTSYDSGVLYAPLCEIITPNAALTIEEGTI